jgi:hypothetical protein
MKELLALQNKYISYLEGLCYDYERELWLNNIQPVTKFDTKIELLKIEIKNSEKRNRISNS